MKRELRVQLRDKDSVVTMAAVFIRRVRAVSVVILQVDKEMM